MIKLIRIRELSSLISSSRSKIYADIKEGTFVPPVSLDVRSVAFPDNEVAEWIRARIAGASKEELKTLVATLVSRRKPPSGSPPSSGTHSDSSEASGH